MYNNTYKKGDGGGNFEKILSINVTTFTNSTTINLHLYWDSGALFLDPYDNYI